MNREAQAVEYEVSPLTSGLAMLRLISATTCGGPLRQDEADALIAEREELQRAAKVLAVLALQSDRHTTDEEFRLAVGAVLALTREVAL